MNRKGILDGCTCLEGFQFFDDIYKDCRQDPYTLVKNSSVINLNGSINKI